MCCSFLYPILAILGINLFLCKNNYDIQGYMGTQAEIKQSIRDTASKVLPAGAQLILFGSQARGDAREDSDWDLLILLAQDKVNHDDYNNIVFPLVELGWKINAQINPLVYTYAEWEKRYFTPFYKNVKQDGIVLCH